MKFEVKNRFSGDVQFIAEIHTGSEDTPFRLGLAVQWAMGNGTDLCRTNLRDANLRGVDLRGANLRDANLRDADLCGANLEHNKTVISCGLGDYAMLIHQGREGLMVKAGCRYFSIDEAKKHWNENKNSWTTKTDEYGERQLRMLAFLESEASVLGWAAEAGQVDTPINALGEGK